MGDGLAGGGTFKIGRSSQVSFNNTNSKQVRNNGGRSSIVPSYNAGNSDTMIAN